MDLGKKGTRVLGVAESSGGDLSVLGGVVMRADGRVDGFCFGGITVGGLDSTDKVVDMFRGLGREDLHLLMVSGLALAWYNILDLDDIHHRLGVPVVSVTYEESPGLTEAIKREFSGKEKRERLDLYKRQVNRVSVDLSTGETVYIRAIGLDINEAGRLVDRFTTHGGHPEPLRIARLAASSVREYMGCV